jgi:hypothetical protein
MSGYLSKEEIIQQLQKAAADFTGCCAMITEGLFFSQPPAKWSIAQNTRHLIIAADKTRLAYSLPKFMLQLITGKPNRSSRTYDELVEKYQLKLQQGGRAGKAFTPQSISSNISKEKMITDFSKAMKRLIQKIQQNWKDEQLDEYLAPHPLLGKITHRELCYFTIYHTYHHLATIQTRLKELAAAIH